MRSTAYRIPQSARQIASRCAIVPRNQAHQSPLSAPFTSVRALSSSSRRSTVLDTISSVAQSVKELVTPEKKGYVEGDKQREEGLRMLMFGKPGSGKGTLSARLLKLYDIAFVSTGDVLRKEIAAKTPLGLRAEEIVRTGGLVSDELMLQIVKSELDRLRGKSWIIDGFPRTLHQGKLLDMELNKEGRPLNMIVHLNVPDSVIMARITARWVHLPSGRVYNTSYSAPMVEGIDDVTGEPLTKRPDDTPEVFTKRLQAYYKSTAPLLEYFSNAYPEALHSLSGSTSDEVLFASGLYKTPPPPPILASSRNDQLFISPSPPDPDPDYDSYYKREWEDSDTSSSSSNTQSPSISTTSPNTHAPYHTNDHPHTLLSADGPAATSNLNSLDQLWPQLQELIEPFGLKERTPELGPEQTESVRDKADDLKDPEEDVKQTIQ